MKRRVTDRAVLRRLKRSGIDVEAIRKEIAAGKPTRRLFLFDFLGLCAVVSPPNRKPPVVPE